MTRWNIGRVLAGQCKVLQDTGLRHRVAAIRLTVQRETCLLWDKTTGKPLHNAIVWQTATAPLCNQLAQGYASQSAIALAGPRRLFFRD